MFDQAKCLQIILGSVCLFTVFLFTPLKAQAQLAAPDLYLSSSVSGSTLTVTVTSDFTVAENTTPVQVITFSLEYNTSTLTYVSVANGTATANNTSPNKTWTPTVGTSISGVLNFDSFTFGSGLSGSAQPIAVFTFNITSPGSYGLTLLLNSDCPPLSPGDCATFTNSDSSTTDVVNFGETLAAAASPGGSGTVTCGDSSTACTTPVAQNNSIEFFSNPSGGDALASWTVSGSTPGSDCGGTTGTCTVDITAPTSVTANIAVAPSITSNPSNITVSAGSTATFTVSASGTAPLSYEWMQSPDGITWSGVSGGSGASTASYTTPATTFANNGYEYECVVYGVGSPATSLPATLTVDAPPSITASPSNLTVAVGATATFTVTASGTAPLTYQWQESVNGGGYVNVSTGSGGTTASFTTDATVAGDNGTKFECVVTGYGAATATSNPATLTVDFPAGITTSPSDTTVTAPATATFTVVASGNPAPTYQWQSEAPGAMSFTNIVGATSASYITPATDLSYNGTLYQCVVTGYSASTATSGTATLTVYTVPSFSTPPTGQTTTAGSTATFMVVAAGNPAPTYQWMKSVNGEAYTNISLATSSSYTTPVTSAADNGTNFECVLTNAAVGGTATSNPATLIVNYAPIITASPASQSIASGSSVTFTVGFNANPAPASNGYQWQLSTDGGTTFNPIAGATGSIFTINPVAYAQNTFQYNCIVTNTVGSTTSAAATLSVYVNGACGPAAATYPYIKNSSRTLGTLCDAGTPDSSPGFPAAGQSSPWNCIGINGGATASCSAKQNPAIRFRF